MNNNGNNLRKNLYFMVYNSIILQEPAAAARFFNENPKLKPAFESVKDINLHGEVGCAKEITFINIASHRRNGYAEYSEGQIVSFELAEQKKLGVDFHLFNTAVTTRLTPRFDYPVYTHKYDRYLSYVYDDISHDQYKGILSFRGTETPDDIDDFNHLNKYFERVRDYINTSGACIDQTKFRFKHKNEASLIFYQKDHHVDDITGHPELTEKTKAEFLNCLTVYGALALLNAKKILEDIKKNPNILNKGYDDGLNTTVQVSYVLDVSNPTFQRICPEIYKIISNSSSQLLLFSDEMVSMSSAIAASAIAFGLLDEDENTFDFLTDEYSSITFRNTTKAVEDSEFRLNIAYQLDDGHSVHSELFKAIKKKAEAMDTTYDTITDSVEDLIEKLAEKAGIPKETIEAAKKSARSEALEILNKMDPYEPLSDEELQAILSKDTKSKFLN